MSKCNGCAREKCFYRDETVVDCPRFWPTNADKIRGMSDEELAKTSVYCTAKPDYNEGIDGEWYEFGEVETWHSVFTKDLYTCEEDAIAYTLDWLRQPAETEGAE